MMIHLCHCLCQWQWLFFWLDDLSSKIVPELSELYRNPVIKCFPMPEPFEESYPQIDQDWQSDKDQEVGPFYGALGNFLLLFLGARNALFSCNLWLESLFLARLLSLLGSYSCLQLVLLLLLRFFRGESSCKRPLRMHFFLPKIVARPLSYIALDKPQSMKNWKK